MGQLQMAMNMDKEAWGGKKPKLRYKSCLERKSIGDIGARSQRVKWAAEFAKVHPGMYAPYPGRPVRPDPGSAAAKARSARRRA